MGTDSHISSDKLIKTCTNIAAIYYRGDVCYRSLSYIAVTFVKDLCHINIAVMFVTVVVVLRPR